MNKSIYLVTAIREDVSSYYVIKYQELYLSTIRDDGALSRLDHRQRFALKMPVRSVAKYIRNLADFDRKLYKIVKVKRNSK